ncbi:hypothetical protein [Janthinobacterium sp.]|uniref:hypothetical protein n=1 Tax=Janthinobacterium sp. TaxID=1871054 RepID=UPI00289E8A6E|nr:hypothetical protein [Janthinobacterium sp.]
MPPVQWQAFIAQFSQFSQFVAAPAPGRHRRVAGRRGAGCRHRPDRAAGATPASHTDTFEGQKMVGDHWSVAGKTALLVVPCVIVSDECNVLLNRATPLPQRSLPAPCGAGRTIRVSFREAGVDNGSMKTAPGRRRFCIPIVQSVDQKNL